MLLLLLPPMGLSSYPPQHRLYSGLGNKCNNDADGEMAKVNKMV
jgi:hypothetical protein